MRPSVVVQNLNLVSITVFETKAHAPLVVDPDAVFTHGLALRMRDPPANNAYAVGPGSRSLPSLAGMTVVCGYSAGAGIPAGSLSSVNWRSGCIRNELNAPSIKTPIASTKGSCLSPV